MVETRLALGGFDRLYDGFHVLTPLVFIFALPVTRALSSPAPDDATYKGQSKIGLNNTIKIRFICNGEDSVVIAIETNDATFRSPCAAAVHVSAACKSAISRARSE
jgi:hypothetical protein